MIDLERHIELLLLDNDCVIVPGLGGFVAHHVDARYDEREHLFLPPLRTLGFNAKLRMNDSLLAQSYIEAYDISYPEATRRIEEEVAELRQHLENDGHYELNGIGELFLNSDGNFEFEPCEAGILTPELYGLCGVEISHVDETAVLFERDDETLGAIAEDKLKIQGNGEGRDHVSKSEKDGDNDRRISIRVSLIRDAVAVAAALIAFFVVSTPLGNSDKNDAALSTSTGMLLKVMPKAFVLDSPAQESLEGQVVPTTEEKLQIRSNENKEKGKESINHQRAMSNTQNASWCLVLASHVPLENANVFVNHLHAAGHVEARVFTRANINKVVYGNYVTAEQAHQALMQLRGENDFQNAWVYEIK